MRLKLEVGLVERRVLAPVEEYRTSGGSTGGCEGSFPLASFPHLVLAVVSTLLLAVRGVIRSLAYNLTTSNPPTPSSYHGARSDPLKSLLAPNNIISVNFMGFSTPPSLFSSWPPSKPLPSNGRPLRHGRRQ